MTILKNFWVLIFLLFSFSAMAADLEWSGLYRVEFDSIHEPDLQNPGISDEYGLQHLILRPKVIASDGFTIRSQFDVFNNAQYPNTALGQAWGNNVHTPGAAIATQPGSSVPTSGTWADDSNVMQGAGANGTIQVSQLYMTWDMEFGSLIVGRAPLQFGLGMTYSAGQGLFDHYYNTLDLIGFKLIYGNLWVMPMVGKSSSGQPNRNDDVDDYMMQAQYDSPEGDFEMGAIYHLRRAGNQGADTPLNVQTGNGANATPTAGDTVVGGAGANNDNSVGIQTINFYALKDTPRIRFGAEFGFQQGQMGVQATPGTGAQRVTIGGFGLASEFEWRPLDSSWKFGAKGGIATGDDPNTAKFEGFFFNRNYDVAFLLFNHPMGQYDLFRTRLIGGGGGIPSTTTTTGYNEINGPDTETISNVMYLAPYALYHLSDKWTMKGVLATGYLYVDPIVNASVSKAVGYEFDYSVAFSPRKNVTWNNEVGLLFPGAAFSGDGSYGHSFTYGLQTQAAITF